MALTPAVSEPDAHVLSNLTDVKQTLDNIITGGGPCPALPAQPPAFTAAASATTYGCPLKSFASSGTYERSGMAVVFQPGIWDLFSTAKGGRTNSHKVLVLETDGSNANIPLSTAVADANSIAAANRVKLGADGIAGSPLPIPDDVEIFTIGFFSGGFSGLISGSTPLCPSNTLPPGRTSIDDMLIAMSSSAPGTCDHYFPQNKTSNLSSVFTTVASAISRGQLLQ
jgi:hypothetical protein